MNAPRRSFLARVLFVLAVVAAVAGAVTARVVVSGEREIAASTQALEAGQPRDAIVHARRAAGWYAPGAPHVSVAYRRLVALAKAAEAHRRDDLALLAWRGIRSASIETRWLFTPHADDLARANAEIARIEAKVPKQKEPDAEIATSQLQKLRRHEPPHRLWIAALGLGFLLTTAGFATGSRQAARAGGSLDLRSARIPVVITVVGLVLWVVALWRA